MEPSWLPQYHQTNLGINNRIIKEHDYIIGLANNSSTSTSSSSKFTHNTMNHDLCNLNNTHHKNDDDDDDDDDDGGGGGGAPAHDDGDEEDQTDLCLGLGLPGSRNPAKNGNISNNNIIIKPITTINPTTSTTTTTTTTTINLNHTHNNGVKRGYNEAILLLDRYSTTLPTTATNRPNEKLPCEPPLNNCNDPDNTNANANVNGGVIGVGIGVGVGVAIGHGANDPPPAKDRVIGWPPIRSYRKNTIVKPLEIFVKVNMDGVAVGRKVDLNAHNSYEGLLFALEDMFLPSNSGGSSLGDSKHLRLLNGSDYVLTYEDKDGDWMLVGDVPWSMFTNTVKRLRIQRGTESMGIGKPLRK